MENLVTPPTHFVNQTSPSKTTLLNIPNPESQPYNKILCIRKKISNPNIALIPYYRKMINKLPGWPHQGEMQLPVGVVSCDLDFEGFPMRTWS